MNSTHIHQHADSTAHAHPHENKTQEKTSQMTQKRRNLHKRPNSHEHSKIHHNHSVRTSDAAEGAGGPDTGAEALASDFASSVLSISRC